AQAEHRTDAAADVEGRLRWRPARRDVPADAESANRRRGQPGPVEPQPDESAVGPAQEKRSQAPGQEEGGGRGRETSRNAARRGRRTGQNFGRDRPKLSRIASGE